VGVKFLPPLGVDIGGRKEIRISVIHASKYQEAFRVNLHGFY
jgi:hypothetical protein